MLWTPRLLTFCLIVLVTPSLAVGQDGPRKIEFSVVEKKTSKPIPCRIHLKDKAGKPQQAGTLPF
ncbi:MAG TPA: hypothetical protein VGX70_06065, partial [Gemmataceae bacterium]|nr:hypothetical protein [Gemmataceae bacterium]